MAETKKIRTTVDIYGQQYVIVGTESSSHIRLVASMVDDKMREIGSKNPSLDVSKLAVLTALNAMNDLVKLKDHVEKLESELNRVKE
ncbi:cell division protein ZapA [Pseudoneobacillus rhizosphaerae]|uniref:Cell division protein ZapA n=1 Tax=Pseudoneobacillus rhizosphaerae TaxID=2880968 RepID=A0A9C7GB01_9BACI|nr:cell division protein ZapA [Pseudoneobacillus rhizosphaerae]CAG9608842.1 Cell division protein ZapA [Pseudoneobacillus rhizosphaerae]